MWELRIFGVTTPDSEGNEFQHEDADPLLDDVVKYLREKGHVIQEAHILHGAIRGGAIIKKYEELGASSESVELTAADVGTIGSEELTATTG